MLEGNVEKQLLKYTYPMIFGVLGLVFFNLVDTYYIGLLGTNELAAISFTFPVVLTINSITQGIATGVTAAVSKEFGENGKSKLSNLIFDSLVLALIIAAVFTVLGFIFIEDIFTLIGVPAELMTMTLEYMKIWMLGIIFIVTPMVGNGIIRSLGDTKTPSMVMIFSGLANAIVDPLLIFGIGIFPEMGIAGAAMATVFSRFLTFLFALYVLVKRERVLRFIPHPKEELLINWKCVVTIGVPSAFGKIILPIGMGTITAIIAGYGTIAVAGYGVATKIETLLLVFCSALASTMVPFIGQNLGAKKFDRIIDVKKYATKLTIVIHLIITIILLLISDLIVGFFTKDPEVIIVASSYLKIASLGYGFKGVILQSTAILNVYGKPLKAVWINIVQMFIIFIPLSYLLNGYFELLGIFIAFATSLIIAGITAIIVTDKVVKNH